MYMVVRFAIQVNAHVVSLTLAVFGLTLREIHRNYLNICISKFHIIRTYIMKHFRVEVLQKKNKERKKIKKCHVTLLVYSYICSNYIMLAFKYRQLAIGINYIDAVA